MTMQNPPQVSWSGTTASFEVPDTEQDGGKETFVVKFEPKVFLRRSRGKRHRQVDGFEISFAKAAEQGAPGEFDVKNNAGIDALDVFGGCIEAIKEFQINEKPDMLWYAAAEPSRIGVYASMLPRQVTDGYVCEYSVRGNVRDRGEFTILRKDLVGR